MLLSLVNSQSPDPLNTRSASPAEMASQSLLVGTNQRIANHLAVVSALFRMHSSEVRRRSAALSPIETAELLDKACVRANVVGQLHRPLASDSSYLVPLNDFLGKITENAAISMVPSGRTRLTVRCDEGRLIDAKQVLFIGFIVSELVTNAINYAHPAAGVWGSIEVSCEDSSSNGLLVRVVDDGVGLPENFAVDKDGGLGMRTMQAIADELGATLTFESTGLGLEASLHLPSSALDRAAR